jgi:hypothetical protein
VKKSGSAPAKRLCIKETIKIQEVKIPCSPSCTPPIKMSSKIVISESQGGLPRMLDLADEGTAITRNIGKYPPQNPSLIHEITKV